MNFPDYCNTIYLIIIIVVVFIIIIIMIFMIIISGQDTARNKRGDDNQEWMGKLCDNAEVSWWCEAAQHPAFRQAASDVSSQASPWHEGQLRPLPSVPATSWKNIKQQCFRNVSENGRSPFVSARGYYNAVPRVGLFDHGTRRCEKVGNQ